MTDTQQEESAGSTAHSAEFAGNIPSKLQDLRARFDEAETETPGLSPFGRIYPEATGKGWIVLPTHPKTTRAVLEGLHGKEPRLITLEEIERFSYGEWGAAVWAPEMIQVDVDGYDGKPGAETLQKAIDSCGPMMATFTNTSRDAKGPSRHHFYFDPEGADLEYKPDGGGIEIKTWRNGYVVVGPSINDKTGKEYRFFDDKGDESSMPYVEDLKKNYRLPKVFHEYWSKANQRRLKLESRRSKNSSRHDFDRSHASNGNEASHDMGSEGGAPHTNGYTAGFKGQDDIPGSLEIFRRDVQVEGERYAAMMAFQLAVIRKHSKGLPGAIDALIAGRELYRSNSGNDDPEGEWDRAIDGAWDLFGAQGESHESHDDDDEPHVPLRHSEIMAAASGVKIVPTMFTRTDAESLIYRGKVNMFFGASTHGKSAAAQMLCIERLRLGEKVMYIDFEDDSLGIAERLTDYGFEPEFDENLWIISLDESPDEEKWWKSMMNSRYDLIIFDGMTTALKCWGVNPNDNAEVAGWMDNPPRKLAKLTGAGILIIDHVPRSQNTTTPQPIAAQQKMAKITGTAIYVTLGSGDLGKGKRATIKLTKAKDKKGIITCDENKVVGIIDVDFTESDIANWELKSPFTEGRSPVITQTSRESMFKIDALRFIRKNPGLNQSALFARIPVEVGKAIGPRQLIESFLVEGKIWFDEGCRGAKLHYLSDDMEDFFLDEESFNPAKDPDEQRERDTRSLDPNPPSRKLDESSRAKIKKTRNDRIIEIVSETPTLNKLQLQSRITSTIGGDLTTVTEEIESMIRERALVYGNAGHIHTPSPEEQALLDLEKEDFLGQFSD